MSQQEIEDALIYWFLRDGWLINSRGLAVSEKGDYHEVDLHKLADYIINEMRSSHDR